MVLFGMPKTVIKLDFQKEKKKKKKEPGLQTQAIFSFQIACITENTDVLKDLGEIIGKNIFVS